MNDPRVVESVTNVPRELLADLLGNDHDKRIMAERHLLAMLANAPSPAGVDGLEVVATLLIDDPTDQECGDWDIEVESKVAERMSEHGGGQHELCRLSDATAIIDGLRGEVAEQEETANQWRELALQFDRHRVTAMAHIRAAASGDKSAIEALGVFAALPPIPGHEITAERDQQAQRIGELASHLEFAVTILTVAGLAGNAQVEAMRSALSAGKDSVS